MTTPSKSLPPSLRSQSFTFPRGCSIARIVIRETDGNDERVAALAMEAKGKGVTTMVEELIRCATVAFWTLDGTQVGPDSTGAPLDGVMEWSTRTRDLVLAAFDRLNGTTSTEKLDFLAGGVPVGPDLAPVDVAPAAPPATKAADAVDLSPPA